MIIDACRFLIELVSQSGFDAIGWLCRMTHTTHRKATFHIASRCTVKLIWKKLFDHCRTVLFRLLKRTLGEALSGGFVQSGLIKTRRLAHLTLRPGTGNCTGNCIRHGHAGFDRQIHVINGCPV